MQAQSCAATPDAAVLEALSTSGAHDGTIGFRVRNVVFDPLLRRAFVEVESCEHPERPGVLLPFAAAKLAGPTGSFAATATLSGAAHAVDEVPSGSVVAVRMGDAHVSLTVRGRVLAAAAVGSEVDVELASLGEGPAAQPGQVGRRVHGRLTAADRVEVQP